jgi:AbrB family looped-hinge helix DNA binding protein
VTVKITSKGQVTIPQELRERLGLLPHTEVEFERAEDGVVLRKARGSRRRGAGVVAHLKGRGTTRMTTDEILALTRGGEAPGA